MRTDFIILIVFLAVALGSMPIYAFTGRHRSHDPLESSSRGKFILGPFVRSWFYWFVHPIVAVSLALRLPPAFYNLLGVAFGVAGGVAGPRGAFMDSTLDRFAEFGAFVGLAVWFADTPLALILVVAGLGGSLITSYARARGEVEGVLCTAGVMQRAERLLILGFGGLLDPSLARFFGDGTPGNFLIVALGVVAVGTVGTAIYRTVWILQRLPRTGP